MDHVGDRQEISCVATHHKKQSRVDCQDVTVKAEVGSLCADSFLRFRGHVGDDKARTESQVDR